MLANWAAWFAGTPAVRDDIDRDLVDGVDMAQRPRTRFRQYLLWQLTRDNPAFVSDDVDHGRRVIDAALELGEALNVQRRRFGVSSNVAVANAIARLVLECDGAADLAARQRFNTFLAATTPETINLDSIADHPADPLALDIIAVWGAVLECSAAARIQGTFVSGSSRHHMPEALYRQWGLTAGQQSLEASNDSCQVLNVSYTARNSCGGDASGRIFDEANHGAVAQQALMPLMSQVTLMLDDESIDSDAIRLDVTLNVELIQSAQRVSGGGGDDDDDDESSTLTPAPSETKTTARCALAYRLHVVNAQRVVYENEVSS